MARQINPMDTLPFDDSVIRGPERDDQSAMFDDRTVAFTPGPVTTSTVQKERRCHIIFV